MKKLPSDLPLDQGLFKSAPKPLQQLRLQIMLLPGKADEVRIMPDPSYPPFHLVNWIPGEEGKKEMFKQIKDMIADTNGWKYIGDKIEIAPEPNVPFEFVALTLDAVHKAKAEKEAAILEQMKGLPENSPQYKALKDKLKTVTFKAAPPEGRSE